MADHLPPGDDNSAISDDNRIKVVCRVRPPVMRETHGAKGLANRCVDVEKDRRTIVLSSKPQGKSFTFDYAAGEDSTQEEIFAEVGQPVTEACLEGYNGTIFCYGQTGSGKTFTTFGPGAVMENHLNPGEPKSYALRGLVPRVLEYLYDSIGQRIANGGGKVSYTCRCSFYEIFNEKVFDLVDESNRDNPMGLAVREDTRKGVYVEGLMEEEVEGADSACEVLYRGFRNRHVGETAMNRESSRSHAVFTLVIQATEVVEEEGLTRSRVARFNLVDLAGSERQKDTQASGERLKEASNINKSLSTLGQVINALVEKSAGRFRHVHYRDSKLTFLLRDSLGGNSKTMLVAAVSPADQNFGETLSTLKFAQRAKMIKNQAVKNEDTNGSFDALRREVTSLRQQLAAKQLEEQEGTAVTGVPCDIATTRSGIYPEFALAGTSSEALLADALKRARSAEEGQEGSRRRVETLLTAVERSEKDALQLKMVIKFRDGTIAAQRKKDADQERVHLEEENAHLRKQLEAGIGESSEVSKWRLQCKEAEARLAELTGDQSGDAKRLVWGVADEERFRGELDEKVLSLMEENRLLKEETDAFEERLLYETRRAEKRRLSAENRAEFEAKKIVENALLSKLKGAQGRVEKTTAALASSEARNLALETERAQQGAAVAALTKQLQDAHRRVAEAVRDRDVRLSDLQSKIEELTRAKERATEDSGSEVASLELKLATAIKDNSELLKANKALEEEADGLDQELERLEGEKNIQEEAANAERERAAEALASLNQRMQQQEEAHDRETDEIQSEKRSVMEDLEAATDRFKSAKESHAREVKEQQRCTSNLQERLAETLTQVEQSEGHLKQLRDDYDTLSEQARFSQDRVEELEQRLELTVSDLLQSRAHTESVEDELLDAERRAEGEEFFKLAQEQLTVQAQEACAERDQTIELLEEELEAAKAYAAGVRMLLAAQEKEEEDIERLPRIMDEMEIAHAVGGVAMAAVEVREDAACTGLLSSMLQEHEGAVERIEELENIVAGLEEGRELLETEVDLVKRQHQAVSEAFEDLEAVHSCAMRDLFSAQRVAAELEEEIIVARSGAAEAEKQTKDLEWQLEKVRDSCFEYQARAVASEEKVETLMADVARLTGEVESEQAAAVDAARRAGEAEKAATEREVSLLAAVKASKAMVSAREEEVTAKEAELAAAEAFMASMTEEASLKAQNLAAIEAVLVNKTEELAASEAAMTIKAEEASMKTEELALTAASLASKTEEARVTAEQLAKAKTTLARKAEEESAREDQLTATEASLISMKEEASAKAEQLFETEAALSSKTEEAHLKSEKLAKTKAALVREAEEANAKAEELVATKASLDSKTKEAHVKANELAAMEVALASKSEEARVKAEQLAATEAFLASKTEEAKAKAEELVATEASLASKAEEAKSKAEELALSEASLASKTHEANAKAEELAATEASLASKSEEANAKAEELAATKTFLARMMEEASAKAKHLAITEASLASKSEEANAKAEELAAMEVALASKSEEARMKAEQLAETKSALVSKMDEVRVIAEQLAATEACLASKAEEAKAKAEELVATEASLASKTQEARVKAEELAVSEASLASKTEEVSSKADELAATEASLASKSEEANAKAEELAATKVFLASMTEEANAKAEELAATKVFLASMTEEASAKAKHLATTEASLASKAEEAKSKAEELAATKNSLASKSEEIRAKEEQLVETEAILARKLEEMSVKAKQLAETEAILASKSEEANAKNARLVEALQAREAGKTELEAVRAELDRVRADESQVTEELTIARSSVKELGKEIASTKKDLAEANSLVAAHKEELISTVAELEKAAENVTVVKGAFEQARHRLEKAEKVEAKLRVALSDSEKRISNEEAKTMAANARAGEADLLRNEAERASKDAERNLRHSAREAAMLREEVGNAATRLEGVETENRELTGCVVDLENEIKQLRQALVSDEERAFLQSGLESARLELTETQETLKAATARSTDLEEALVAIRGETEGYTAKVMELKDVNASLVGHKNSKQRIQQVQRLKDENNLLTRKVKELEDRLFAVKRSGCGSVCGRHGGASASNEADSSTSSGGSQQSLSPQLRARPGDAREAGCGGKVYNLRRRAKTMEEAPGETGDGSSSVALTRGRRTGLRDLTNAR